MQRPTGTVLKQYEKAVQTCLKETISCYVLHEKVLVCCDREQACTLTRPGLDHPNLISVSVKVFNF